MSDGATTTGGQVEDQGGNQGGNQGGKTYTDADLNRIAAEAKRKHQKELNELNSRFETLRQQTEELLGGRPLDEFRGELEQTAAKLRSAEENAKIEKSRYDRELKEAKEAATSSKKLYEDTVIGRALTDAALEEGKVISLDAANLLATALRPYSKLAEVEGKPTTIVELEVEEEGIKTKKQLSPKQAIELYESKQGWAPLFKSSVSGGTGGDVNKFGSKRKVDLSKMTAEEYRAFRKDNPDYLNQIQASR